MDFTITIKPITVNAENFSNTMKRKIARVSELDEENGTYTLSAYLIHNWERTLRMELMRRLPENSTSCGCSTIKELQYMAGGMVIFLEAEDNDKLMHFMKIRMGLSSLMSEK